MKPLSLRRGAQPYCVRGLGTYFCLIGFFIWWLLAKKWPIFIMGGGAVRWHFWRLCGVANFWETARGQKNLSSCISQFLWPVACSDISCVNHTGLLDTSTPNTGALFGALWSSLDFEATPSSGVHMHLYMYVRSQISHKNRIVRQDPGIVWKVTYSSCMVSQKDQTLANTQMRK